MIGQTCQQPIQMVSNTYKLVYKLLRCTGSTINPSVNLVTSKVSRVWGVWGHKIHSSVVWSLFFSCLNNPPFCPRSSCLRVQWRSKPIVSYAFIIIHICYHTLHHMLGIFFLRIPSILVLRTPGYCSRYQGEPIAKLRPYLQLPLGSSVSSRWSPIRPRKHRKPAKL